MHKLGKHGRAKKGRGAVYLAFAFSSLPLPPCLDNFFFFFFLFLSLSFCSCFYTRTHTLASCANLSLTGRARGEKRRGGRGSTMYQIPSFVFKSSFLFSSPLPFYNSACFSFLVCFSPLTFYDPSSSWGGSLATVFFLFCSKAMPWDGRFGDSSKTRWRPLLYI